MEKSDFPGASRYSVLLGEYPSFCEEQIFGYKGVVSHQFGCLCALGTIRLELLILGFGYFSIKLYVLLLPQMPSVGPVRVPVGMKQIRYFLHVISDKRIFLAQHLIFDAISVCTALENPEKKAWQEWPCGHC